MTVSINRTLLTLFLACACVLSLTGCSKAQDLEQEAVSAPRSGLPSIKTWLCYYGDRHDPETYSRFDLVVLDGSQHPSQLRMPGKRPVFLGYLSVGEVGAGSPMWSVAKAQPYLVKHNEFWDSWLVDVRNPAWQRLLFENADRILSQGFDGLFLDTIDSSLSLLDGDGGKTYQGTNEALRHILESLRAMHPGKYIAVNRGLPVLPFLAPVIDLVLIEGLYSSFAGAEKGYARVDGQTRDLLLRQVAEGVRINPSLTVLTLDYADSTQVELAKEAIAFSRSRGFSPYVSTLALDQIFLHTLNQ